jgi:hypothetical protein
MTWLAAVVMYIAVVWLLAGLCGMNDRDDNGCGGAA